MNEYLKMSLSAVGGLSEWQRLKSLNCQVSYAGALLQIKGQAHALEEIVAQIDVSTNTIKYSATTDSNREASFAPAKVSILDSLGHGTERQKPRESFKGHSADTKWDDLHLVYFVGASLRTSLLSPLLLLGGHSVIESQELIEVDGKAFNKLQAKFQTSAMPFSNEQTYYLDAKTNLLARVDYEFDLCGDTAVSHFFSEYKESGGILFPLKHRVLVRRDNGEVLPMPVVVSIDIKNVKTEFQTKKAVK